MSAKIKSEVQPPAAATQEPDDSVADRYDLGYQHGWKDGRIAGLAAPLQPAAAAPPIDLLDLEPIKAREAAATPGPWKMFNGYGPCPDGRHRVERFGNDDGAAVLATEGRSEDIAGLQSDWEFLAHARQDIPILIAEVARLRALQGTEQSENDTRVDNGIGRRSTGSTAATNEVR